LVHRDISIPPVTFSTQYAVAKGPSFNSAIATAAITWRLSGF
jgi:hypothetical protein